MQAEITFLENTAGTRVADILKKIRAINLSNNFSGSSRKVIGMNALWDMKNT